MTVLHPWVIWIMPETKGALLEEIQKKLGINRGRMEGKYANLYGRYEALTI